MKTRKLLAAVLSLVMVISALPIFTLTASAATELESGSCGSNVTYLLDSDGLLTISGTGAMTSAPWINNGNFKKIKNVVIEDGVTSIYTSAFRGCSSLQSVTVKGDLAEVGGSAFQTCVDLESVTFEGNVGKIGSYAFYSSGYNSVKGEFGITVTIKGNVSELGSNLFDCSYSAFCIDYHGTTVPSYTSNLYSGDVYASYSKIYVTPEYYLKSTFFHNRGVVRPELNIKVNSIGSGTAEVYYNSNPVTKLGVKLSGTLVATPDDGYYLKEYQVVSGDVTINESNKFTVGASDIEINAVFGKIPDGAYTISFDANEGSGEMPMTVVESNGTKTLPKCGFTRLYYTFGGWKTSADAADIAYTDMGDISGSELTENITLYAHWNPAQYTVKFDANGGSDSMDALEGVAAKTKITLPDCTFKGPDGKIFIGWTIGTGTTVYQPGSTYSVTNDITLYAQWAEPVAEVKTDGNTTEYGTLPLALAAVKEKTGELKLLADITLTSFANVAPTKLTIDLNNHSIKSGATRAYLQLKNEVTIKGTGTISGESNFYPIYVSTDAIVTVEDGVTISRNGEHAIYMSSDSTLIFNGGTVTAGNGTATANIIGASGSTVVINSDISANLFNCANVYYNITPASTPTNNYSTGKIWYLIDNQITNADVTADETTIYDDNTYSTADTTVIVKPKENYTLSGVKYNGIDATESDGSFTFKMPVGVAKITETIETSVTLTNDSVAVALSSDVEAAVLIVASYDGGSLIDVKYLPISAATEKKLGTDGMGLTYSSGNEVNAFLWEDMSALTPICNGKAITITETAE